VATINFITPEVRARREYEANWRAAGKAAHAAGLVTRTIGGRTVLSAVTLLESDPHLLWLAGLLEGEGHFQQSPSNIVLLMTDLDVVQRACDMSLCGNMNGPFLKDKPNHKPIWRWKVSKAADVWVLGNLLLPHMGVRRAGAIKRMLMALRAVKTCDVRHGTTAQYRRGCRCDDCKGAWTHYNRTRAEQKAAA
jgi:hypothetical protein